MPPINSGAYLIVDLRRKKCAIFDLDLKPERATWLGRRYHQLAVLQDAVIHDSVEIADLAFFRAPASRSWRAITAKGLSALPASHVRVPALFEAPADVRRDIGQRGVQSWLNVIAEIARPPQEGQSIEVVYLVEHEEAAQDVNDWRKPDGAHGRVLVVPPEVGDLTAFALIEPGRPELTGAVVWLGKSQNSTVEFEPRAYRWDAGRFEVELAATPPADAAAIGWLGESNDQPTGDGTWPSIDAIERIGAAVFALVWQPYLQQQLQSDLRTWRDRRDRARRILERASRLRAHLHQLASAAAG